MSRSLLLPLTLLLATALTARPVSAEEEPAPEKGAFTFDAVNVPLADVVKKATAAKKQIFIDFFLDG